MLYIYIYTYMLCIIWPCLSSASAPSPEADPHVTSARLLFLVLLLLLVLLVLLSLLSLYHYYHYKVTCWRYRVGNAWVVLCLRSMASRCAPACAPLQQPYAMVRFTKPQRGILYATEMYTPPPINRCSV